MTRFGMLVLTLSAVLALLAQAPTAAPEPAQAAARQRTATELIGSLQSPFCPGLTLPACPSWHADTLRRALRRRILGGEDPGRLRREMAARYGQYVLGEPTWQGFDVIGWLGPGALLLLGGVTLALVLRRYAGRPASAEQRGRPDYVPPLEPLAAEDRARLEQRLQEELRQA